MENAPVISLNGFNPFPGAEPELWERFTKWGDEVYAPLMLKNPSRKGSDTYQLVNKTPLYPLRLRIHHYVNLVSQQNASNTPDQIAIMNDSRSWRERNVSDSVWSAIYQLETTFTKEISQPSEKPDTQIKNATILHIEAFLLNSDEQEKYDKWFADYGINIFIPLYLKQSGVERYDYYRCRGPFRPSNARVSNYPQHLSLVYFNNMEAFSKYENSPELATFLRTLRSIFPQGLDYKWYVQYELKLSLRK